MRKQIITENKGVLDYDPDNSNKSLSRPGYAHHSALEFTEEWLGSFGKWVADLVGESFVVELGCGTAILSRYCKDYVGLDGNVEGGSCCTKEFFAVDLTSPYDFDPPIRADFLVSFDFLEHIEEDKLSNLLRYADNLLKPGAKIFLAVDTTKQETGEHITLRPYEWWDEVLRGVGWIKDELTEDLKKSYKDNLPIHWKKWGADQTQMLFLYRKEGGV